MHIVNFLTTRKIEQYRVCLRLKNVDELERAYVWNYAISAMVFPILGFVELNLRDAIHRVMSQRFAPSSFNDPHDYPWYDSMQKNQFVFPENIKHKIDNVLKNDKGKRKIPQPSTDDVIASLTFGFWTNFIRILPAIDAPNIIPHIFPSHPILNSRQWGNKKYRVALNRQLIVANKLRNRIAHHEPLFIGQLRDESSKSLAHNLKKLRLCVNKCIEISYWINVNAGLALTQSNWYQHFQELSTYDCFTQWVRQGQAPLRRYYC